MGWIWIVVVLAVLGIGGYLIYDNFYHKTPAWVDSILIGIVALSVTIGIIFSLICMVGTLTTQACAENNRINTLEEREVLIALYNKYENLVGQDVTASESYIVIADDILDFNKDLRSNKKWSKSPIWGSMFYNNLNDIEEIKLK